MFVETTIHTDSYFPANLVIYEPETVKEMRENAHFIDTITYRDRFFLTMIPTLLSASGMEFAPLNRPRAWVIGSSGW